MRGIFALIILLSPLACKHYLVEVDTKAEKNQEKGSDYSGTIYIFNHIMIGQLIIRNYIQGSPSWWNMNCKVQLKIKCLGGNQSQCSL